MHCGFIPRDEWLPLPWWQPAGLWPAGPYVRQVGKPHPYYEGAVYAERDPDTGRVSPDVCPGYAARLPIVIESGRAYAAFEKGALATMYPLLTKAVGDGILELHGALNEYQRQSMAAMNKDKPRG